MEKKYNIRPVRAEDYDTLIGWWESYGHMLTPSLGLLPEDGKSGLVIEKEGKMISAAFVYLTNSDMGYIDFMVSNPNYKSRDRFEIITTLIEACSELAIELGCRIIWAMTSYDGIVKRCKKLNYDVLEDKYSVIYTHHKAYEGVVEKQKNGQSSWLSLFTESN
tara:strand:- start:443 stop:931 length:489 start_codon:yes stop_codon:yes gene_type:complete